MKDNKKVMMVGSAEKSNGGVTTVLKILKASPIWKKYNCYWLGTQIQGNKIRKIYYCLKSYFTALFIINKFDIIHFHTVPDISLLVQLPVYILALLWKKKIILHLHVGNQIEDFKSSKLFHFCIKHSSEVLLLANLWVEKFKNLFPEYNIPCDYLYNAFQPVKAIEYSKHTKTIIFAAHLNANKAYDILLKAFKEIHNKYPDWKLIVMGDGEITKAKNLANQLHIEKKVLFTGYVTGDKKEKYFQEGSIFCLCSYKEGFPMVVMEAWAYGIPVITTPVGGLPEVIKENVNAITFQFGNVQELSEKLEYFIKNPQKRFEISSYSQKFVSQFFSIESISQKLDSIYQNI